MNTDVLVQHYDQLTPWERVPLIIAAVLRNDPVEEKRLGSSAPRARYQVPDYWGLLEALIELAHFYLLGQLDLAVLFGEAMMLREQPLPGPRPKPLEPLLRMLAYRMMIGADGWQQLSSELMIDPEVLVRELPGYARVCRVTAQARELAFSAAEARAYLHETGKRRRGDGEGPPGASAQWRLSTAADAAQELRAHLQRRLALWG
jgi:hypothetical protein